MDGPHLLAYSLAGLAFSYILVQFTRGRARNLDHIPTIGSSGWLTSYLGVPRSFLDSPGLTREGYEKYPNGLFKVATADKWMVFCCGQRYAEEISRAGDDQLSNWKALQQAVAMEHSLGPEVVVDPYHIGVIRAALNRNLASCYPDIQDEVVQSFDEVLALDGQDWKAMPAMNAMLRIVCRVSNRLFVGFPLCRDPDYLDMSMTFAIDVMKTAIVVNLTPKFLQPFVGRLVSKLPTYVKRAKKHLGPIIEERLRMEAEHGHDWPGKPNDCITWLLEEGKGEQRSIRNVILRLLMTNFLSVHTTSMALTHALYYLAANPEHAASLRQEADAALNECGWTKGALDRMPKIDSFLRESQRLNPVGSTSMVRITLKDFTFSDGVGIPAGTFICAPLYAMHHDEQKYPNPFDFDPYRFIASPERAAAGTDGPKLQWVTPGTDYLAWGLGRHACPGRWFAVTEVKTMLAHVVTSYDVKLKEGVDKPPNLWFGTTCLPNRSAMVLFRKRQSS